MKITFKWISHIINYKALWVEKTIKLSQLELFLANNTTQPLNAVSPTKIQSGIG